MPPRIKRALKRAGVRAERKIFGKPKEVTITTDKGGLTKDEIKDVLSALSKASRKGDLRPLSFEFRPPTFFAKREALFLIPKDGNIPKARLEIRKAIGAKFGRAFVIDGVKPNIAQQKTTVPPNNKPQISGRGRMRITPKRPRIGR